MSVVVFMKLQPLVERRLVDINLRSVEQESKKSKLRLQALDEEDDH